MSNYRIVFNATATNDVKFTDATIATDGDLTIVLQGGERVLAIPTASVVFAEKLKPQGVPAPPPEDHPMRADVQKD
ncbi:MAG: hypothetical protein LC136_04765 [Burkholderiales bacterium]|nr:hypothetical protein [Burkholderiales bacterium]